MSAGLFVDGQNLINKLHDVAVKELGQKTFDQVNFDYKKLFDSALPGYKLSKRIFYSAKIRQHQDTLKKSQELIQKQRRLKTVLEKTGFDFVMAGNVRGNYEVDQKSGKSVLVFREKGVDVAMAVDAVIMACDKKLKTAILCTSDSDLQPTVSQLKARGVEVVYLGFSMSPNKGLIFTTSKTILFRIEEILNCIK